MKAARNRRVVIHAAADRHPDSQIRIEARTDITQKLQLHRIWALVLEVELTAIGLSDSFFSLGGNSITPIKVVHESKGWH